MNQNNRRAYWKTSQTDTSRVGAILIIEDDLPVGQALELLLVAAGHRATSTADGREALALVARGALQPDVIVVDNNLPGGLTGTGVIARLRNSSPRSSSALLPLATFRWRPLTRLPDWDAHCSQSRQKLRN